VGRKLCMKNNSDSFENDLHYRFRRGKGRW
jgi:hypothetical protein